MKIALILILLISNATQNDLILPMVESNLDYNLSKEVILRRLEGSDPANESTRYEFAIYEHRAGGVIRRIILEGVEIFSDTEQREPGFRRRVHHTHYGMNHVVVIDSMSQIYRNEGAYFLTFGTLYNLMEVENALQESLKNCDRATSKFVKELVYSRLPKLNHLPNYKGLGFFDNDFRPMSKEDGFSDHIKFHFNEVLRNIRIRTINR